MRSSQKTRVESRQNLNRFVCFVAGYLFEFERKLQLEELVVVRIINRLDQPLDTRARKNLERLYSRLHLRRMLHAKQKGREAAAMIQVQMANPDCLKVRPIEVLFGHPMRRVGAAIKQQRTRLSLQPERG